MFRSKHITSIHRFRHRNIQLFSLIIINLDISPTAARNNALMLHTHTPLFGIQWISTWRKIFPDSPDPYLTCRTKKKKKDFKYLEEKNTGWKILITHLEKGSLRLGGENTVLLGFSTMFTITVWDELFFWAFGGLVSRTGLGASCVGNSGLGPRADEGGSR